MHKVDYKRWLAGKINYYISSFEILAEDDYDIILVEEYPCDNKEQLQMRKRYWVENFECVNKNMPGRGVEEWQKTYKDEYAKQQKQYYLDNKDKIAERNERYYLDNKDKILSQMSPKIQCECGAIVSKGYLPKHKRTQRHILATTEVAKEAE
jgi:hypothetical protein